MNHEPTQTTRTVLFQKEAFRIQGAIFEVNRVMGGGFLEAVYQECLAIELAARDIPFKALHPLSLTYKGQLLRRAYVPDFVCFNEIIVELKAVSQIAPEHRAQAINYLKGTGLRLALLANFRPIGRAQVERIIL